MTTDKTLMARALLTEDDYKRLMPDLPMIRTFRERVAQAQQRRDWQVFAEWLRESPESMYHFAADFIEAQLEAEAQR